MRLIHKSFGVIGGFAILLVLLAINTAVLRHQLATQVENQEWFSRSRRVVQELRNTESLLTDAETGQRGYLYTGKVQYLQPYNLAAAQIDAHLQNLNAEIGDNPAQQTKAADLGALIHQKLDELAQTISIFQSGNAEGAKARVMSDRGFHIMQGIRSLVKEMEQEETAVGNQRRAAYQKSIRITVLCFMQPAGSLRWDLSYWRSLSFTRWRRARKTLPLYGEAKNGSG